MLQHVYLIDWSWISVYLRGEFCFLEVDLKIGDLTRTYQFFTNKGLYNAFTSEPISSSASIKRKKPDMCFRTDNKKDDTPMYTWGKRASFFSRYFGNIKKHGDGDD